MILKTSMQQGVLEWGDLVLEGLLFISDILYGSV